MASISATTTTPCPCCVSFVTDCMQSDGFDGIIISVSCSTRGGIAVLCGHREITDPTVPPKKYKTMSFSGRLDHYVYGGADTACEESPVGSGYQEHSGAATYETTPNCLRVTSGLYMPGSYPLNTVPTTSPSSLQISRARTKTSLTQTGTETCVNDAGNTKHLGTLYCILSDPDTEDAAQERAASGAWSTYAVCGSYPCCTASRTARGAGVFSFTYVEARIKIEYMSKTGGALGAVYDIFAEIWWRDLATSEEGYYTEWPTRVGHGTSSALNGPIVHYLPKPPSGYAFFVKDVWYELVGICQEQEQCTSAIGGVWDCLFPTPLVPTGGAAYGCTPIGLLDGGHPTDDPSQGNGTCPSGCYPAELRETIKQYNPSTEVTSLHCVSVRALVLNAHEGASYTIIFQWERATYPTHPLAPPPLVQEWSDAGTETRTVAGHTLPTLTLSSWVTVPLLLGYQYRLKRAYIGASP